MKASEIIKIAKMSKSTINKHIKCLENDRDDEYIKFKNVLGGACTSSATNGMPTGHVKQVIIDFLRSVISGEYKPNEIGYFFSGQLSDEQLKELGFNIS